jgi:AAA15 family ATPase/GTPase
MNSLFCAYSHSQQSTFQQRNLVMIKDIRIQNYRGIKDLHIKDFKRINLLVGDNNSGKTSVLEATTILYPNLVTFFTIIALREFGYMQINKDKNSVDFAINLPSLDKQFYNGNYTKPFKIESILTQSGAKKSEKKLSLEASLSKDYEPFDQIINTQDQRISEINSFIAKYSLGKDSQRLGLSTNGTGKTIGESFGVKHIFISDTTPKGQQIVKQFVPIARASRESEYVKILKIFEPELCNIKQAGDDLIFEKNDKSTVSFSYMGTGFVRFLSILLTIENLKDEAAIISIDEIGNGLHPSKQEIFWEVMFEFLKKNKNLQIFATTHSDESVAALSKVFERRGKKDLGEDEIRLFKIRKTSKEEILVGDYNAEEIEAKVESGLEVR